VKKKKRLREGEAKGSSSFVISGLWINEEEAVYHLHEFQDGWGGRRRQKGEEGGS
jgi:hypothetical protein